MVEQLAMFVEVKMCHLLFSPLCVCVCVCVFTRSALALIVSSSQAGFAAVFRSAAMVVVVVELLVTLIHSPLSHHFSYRFLLVSPPPLQM